MTLGSALLLGVYDVAKKQALKKNSVLFVLLAATALSSIFLSPCLTAGTPHDHARMVFKAILVTSSWVSGLAALKTLPITTASTIKASRPIIVVAMSLLLFGEQLNCWQWGGVVAVIIALLMLSHSSRKEGIVFGKSSGVALMVVSVITGAASALFDKHIMSDMQPLFVQSWANVYVTLMLAACVIVRQSVVPKEKRVKFQWDWMLVLIAVFITAADMLYFFALKQEGALLSIISLIRRSSVIVTFALGAAVFKEQNIKGKAIDLAVMILGLVLLFIGSNIA